MTAGRQRNMAPQPDVDIRMIIQDAQNRWLRPAEVCEILRNYKQHNFKLNPVPPTTPQSGSLFLFDRKSLRYFRKDGHNWRKKKDGKTVREAHERLKAGSIDVLHCYYAHGEDNPNFQRRAYWMLDPAYEHIVLVHYREVTEGNRLCMIRNMHTYGTTETSSSAGNPTALLSQPPPFGHSSVNSLSATTSMASPDTVEMPGTSHSPELEDVESAEPDELEEAVADVANDHSGLQPSLLEQLADRHHAPAIHQPLGPESWQSGLRNTNNLGGMAGQVNAPLFPPKKEFKPQFSDLQNLSQRAPTISSFARTGDVNSISRQFADILDSPGSSYTLPPSSSSNSLDLSGWTNLLENGRGNGGLGNGGGNFVKSELSPSPWEAMLVQVTTPHTRRNLLQGAGLPPGLGQSPLGREASHQIGPDLSPKGKGISDALSPRNLGRQPQSALEADLRNVSEKIVLKEAEEKAHQRNRWQATFPETSMEDANQRLQAQSGAQQMNAMPFGEPDTLVALVRSGQSPKDSTNITKDRLWSQQPQQQQQQQPHGVQNLISQYEHQTNQGQNNLQQQDQKLHVALPSPQQNSNSFGFLDNNSLFSPTIESLLKDVRNDDSSNLGIMESYKKLGSFGKLDSFGRWMNAAEDITDIPPMPGTSGSLWDTGYQEDTMSGVSQHMDEGTSPSPSLSEHLFNLIDVSPEWGSSTEDTKVIICGSFMPTVNYTDYNWGCMFGETEVPVEILEGGALRCRAPPHKPGGVHLYITRNDRQACSQLRTFEYRSPDISSSEVMSSAVDGYSEGEGDTKEDLLLKIRLARMLLGHAKAVHKGRIGNKTETFEERDNDVWTSLEDMANYGERPLMEVKELLLQTVLNRKLKEWLEAKSKLDDGRGPRVLDDRGQGVPHFLAALGYDWSVATLFQDVDFGDDGIPINFRDTAGWTALHWAAKYGREKMVVTLLEAGAAPVLSSDPTHVKPRGETAADLASAGGHGGIAAYLAEKSLTERLSGLTLGERGTIINEIDKMSADLEGEKAVASLARRTSIVRSVRQIEDHERLQTSLEAVRTSTHAAALIQSAFRQHSFRRRAAQLDQDFDPEYGLTSAEMHNFVAARKIQLAFRGHHQKNKIRQHLAATRIQQKFRGWKGRKEFVTIRQRIIKLQAHVRGRLVRNHYRKIIWSVSIVEKIVLRWLRKRKGLRDYKPPVRELEPALDTNEDLIKEGRQMQKEAVQGEVTQVCQMARQKSDREQYTRLREEERRSSANKSEMTEFLASSRDYMDGS